MENFRKLKNIVFINQSLSQGGAENFNLQLLTWFKTQHVGIKAWTTSKTFGNKLRKSGIHVNNIPIIVDIIGDWKGFLKGLFFLLPGIYYYAKLVFQNRNNGVFFLSGYIEKVLVTPWAKLTNSPVVWVEHGPLSPILSKFFGIPGVFYRFVAQFPDYVIFPSRFSMEKNLKISGIEKTKMVVINDGIVPLKKYPVRVIEHSAYCVSRLEKGKGQDILVRAWKDVVKKYPDAKLFIVGSGDFRTVLERLVDELELRKNIVFTGWVRNLALKASSAEIGVFPSVWNLEGFGVVLLEAMSLEKPIVCFNYGPYPEVVDKDCASIVNQKDSKGLSEAIVRMFSDRNLSNKLAKNGKKKYEEFFTLEKCGLGYAAIFERAVKDRGLFKNSSKFSIYLYDILNKGFRVFINDRIKKRRILRRAYYFFTKDFINLENKRLYINKNDTVVSERLITDGVWEPGSTKVFRDYSKKSHIVVDIGANIGYYTLIASGLIKKDGKVVSFEPSNINYNLLNKTVCENNLANVVLVKNAVGEANSTNYLYSVDDNFGDRKMYKTSSKDSMEKVKVITLDNYFSGDVKIDLLKIDIEGYEVKAFKGARRILSHKRIKAIISELRPESLELAGDGWLDYIKLLERYGFDIFNIDGETGEIYRFSKEKTADDYKNDRHLTINILALLKK